MLAQSYHYNWSVVTHHWTAFLAGAWVDVRIASIGFAFACVLGLPVALLRMSSLRMLSWPATVWIQLMRGIPGYVLLLWIYFGLAYAIGLNFSDVQSVILALGLAGSGYTAEIFRAGILTIDVGQSEAAKAIALTRVAAYRHVILPQTLRIVVPPMGNILVSTLKAATIMSVVAVPDMVFRAQDLNNSYFKPFESYTAVAVLLIVIVFAMSAVIAGIERAVRLR